MSIGRKTEAQSFNGLEEKHQTRLPSVIHVYIDEAWPGNQDKSKNYIGVIAGIVWMEGNPNYKSLPAIRTHLHDEGGSALTRLLHHKKAFPFAFPISLPAPFTPNPEKYLELLSDALFLLLGWVLPRPEKTTKVFVHAEHYGIFKDGMDATASFRRLLAGATSMQTSPRFSNWSIERVEWQGKEFGYIPYGDLVGYLFAETPAAKQMAKDFHVVDWPGCVRFSPTLLPALRDLDVREPAGVAGALFQLAWVCGKSDLFRVVLADVLMRAKQNDVLRNALLERICNELENKGRDLRQIARIADTFFAVFPDTDFNGRMKLRFLRLLAILQQANHNGDPDAVEASLIAYDDLRREMLKRDPGLCAYGDLNLAVHLNDKFAFTKAEELLQSSRSAASFPYLSAQNRGRILSSLGQSAALLGKPTEADALFQEALEAFSETGGELEDEADQTRVYRAFASLDALNRDTPAKVAAALTMPIKDAARRPTAISEHPFHEHLLAKLLWYGRDSPIGQDWIRTYISTSSTWSSRPQHPWELILLYRGLLSRKTAHSLASRCFDEWDEWFQNVPHGGTLSLIQGFGLVAMKRHCERQVDLSQLQVLLDSVAKTLPDTAGTVEALLRIAQDTSQESLAELWTLLPFNYK